MLLGDQIRVARLGGKFPYPLNHLAGTCIVLNHISQCCSPGKMGKSFLATRGKKTEVAMIPFCAHTFSKRSCRKEDVFLVSTYDKASNGSISSMVVALLLEL